jgi:hypothetical protein
MGKNKATKPIKPTGPGLVTGAYVVAGRPRQLIKPYGRFD